MEEEITKDGGLTKRILDPAPPNAPIPPLHARCYVHYIGRIVNTDTIFMNTRVESSNPVILVAGRRSAPRELGLHLGIATMRRGERALLTTSPSYAFGSKGNFSFPSIPPDATLSYEIELVDFEAIQDENEKELGDMTFEDRLDAAERRRLVGNGRFQALEFSEALTTYQSALTYLPEDMLLQVEGVYLDRLLAIRHALLLNMAACSLKVDDFSAVIETCNQVLQHESDQSDVMLISKAYYRRGCARRRLGQLDAARKDLEMAKSKRGEDAGKDGGGGHDAAIAHELRLLKEEEKAQEAASAALYRGKLAAPASVSAAALPTAPPKEERVVGGSMGGGMSLRNPSSPSSPPRTPSSPPSEPPSPALPTRRPRNRPGRSEIQPITIPPVLGGRDGASRAMDGAGRASFDSPPFDSWGEEEGGEAIRGWVQWMAIPFWYFMSLVWGLFGWMTSLLRWSGKGRGRGGEGRRKNE